jgi:hypothetical protein
MNMIASDTVFRAVYVSLASLPDRRRVISDDGIRQIEKLLGMSPKTIPIFCCLIRSTIA